MTRTHVRVLMCRNCGAPLEVADAGGMYRCEYCGTTSEVGRKSTEAIRIPSPDEFRGLSPDAMELARIESLRQQARAYDAATNPYAYVTPPPGLESLTRMEDRDPKLLEIVLEQFKKDVEECESTGSLDAQRRVYWLARKIKTIHTLRQDPLRARAAIETAHDLVTDPGYKQLLRCDLADDARSSGDLDAAEVWLAMCDPRPFQLDIDSGYRTSRAMVHLAREQWQQALDLVGTDRHAVPYEPASEVLVTSVRIATLEMLGRQLEAKKELERLVQVKPQRFLESMYQGSKLWAPCRRVWSRLGQLDDYPDLGPAHEREIDLKAKIGCIIATVLLIPLLGLVIYIEKSCDGIEDRVMSWFEKEEVPASETPAEEENPVDPMDLQAMIEDMYEPKPDRLILPGDYCKPVAVSIIDPGRADQEGIARIQLELWCPSVTEKEVCSSKETHTWVRTEEGWDMVGIPKEARYISKNYRNGDYQGAIDAAEIWLDADPNAIDAYRIMYKAKLRLGVEGDELEQIEKDTMRAVMSINPEDSWALYLAATMTDDPEAARRYVEQMAADDCAKQDALFEIAQNMEEPEDRLALAEDVGGEEPLIVMVRIEALHALDRDEEAAKPLDAEMSELVRYELDISDATFAAEWGALIAEVLLGAGRVEEAKDWVDYALNRDPADEKALATSKRVRKHL